MAVCRLASTPLVEPTLCTHAGVWHRGMAQEYDAGYGAGYGTGDGAGVTFVQKPLVFQVLGTLELQHLAP